MNWWIGGGGLTEGQRYMVYLRDPRTGGFYEYHPQGIYVHIHRRKKLLDGRYSTVDELHRQVKALGYSSPGECIITDPPTDEADKLGYLVKIAEAPRPAWETEWESKEGQQDAEDAFLRYLGGQHGPGATSI